MSDEKHDTLGATLVINRNWCKGCGICVEFCPSNSLIMDEMKKANFVYPEKCTGCGMCELRCPDFAIEVKQGG
jgi:2-oxoglutarate ferredoxin oxidoreductase subunit delta